MITHSNVSSQVISSNNVALRFSPIYQHHRRANLSNQLQTVEEEHELAANALSTTKETRVVEPLITALKDRNAYVRREAVFALGQIKDKRALVPLIAILKDENQTVKENAAKSLEEITGETFGQDHAKWEQWIKNRKID